MYQDVAIVSSHVVHSSHYNYNRQYCILVNKINLLSNWMAFSEYLEVIQFKSRLILLPGAAIFTNEVVSIQIIYWTLLLLNLLLNFESASRIIGSAGFNARAVFSRICSTPNVESIANCCISFDPMVFKNHVVQWILVHAN